MSHPQWRIPSARVGSFPLYLPPAPPLASKFMESYKESEDDYGFTDKRYNESRYVMKPPYLSTSPWMKPQNKTPPRPIVGQPLPPLPKMDRIASKQPVKVGAPVGRAHSFMHREKDVIYDANKGGLNQFDAAKLDGGVQMYGSWIGDRQKEQDGIVGTKLGRSKSFLEPSSTDGKVRKMLKKSASILYPSWLSKQSKRLDRSQKLDEETEECRDSVTTSRHRATSEETPNKDIYCWHADDRKNIVSGEHSLHKSNISSQEFSAPLAKIPASVAPPMPQVYLPRQSGKEQTSPTAADHPSTVFCSGNERLRAAHPAARGKSSVHEGAKNTIERKISVASERRWQSMISLPKMKVVQEAGNEASQDLPSVKPKSFYLLDDYLSDGVQVGRKAQSHMSLNPSDLCRFKELTGRQTIISCPSYESLDEYLLTSDDEYRTRPSIGRKKIVNSKLADNWYCDSYDSLPISDRPPPPADADYSPPDISPDDSSDLGHCRRLKHRFDGKQEEKHCRKASRVISKIPMSQTSPEATSKVPTLRLDLQRTKLAHTMDLSRDPNVANSEMLAGTPNPVYLHDWMPPPLTLINCGCRLCQQTVTAASFHRSPQFPTSQLLPNEASRYNARIRREVSFNIHLADLPNKVFFKDVFSFFCHLLKVTFRIIKSIIKYTHNHFQEKLLHM